MRTEPTDSPFPFLIEDILKAQELGCAACGSPAGASLFDLEVGEMPKGWVVIFIHRQVTEPEEGQVTIRWQPYCPEHAPAPDPREARRYGL